MRIISEKHAEIIRQYHAGKTTREIAQCSGITPRGVLYVLHRHGIEIKRRRRAGGYSVNVDFFKSWNSRMAYVLGFVVSDGSIYKNTLTIAQKERYILEHIREAIDSNAPIRKRSNGKSDIFTLSIHSKEIVRDLAALGVGENKSRVLRMPDVPSEFMPHFIRGVIDGDGWIHKRGYVVNITNASKQFVRALYNIFGDRGLNSRITEQDNAYRVWVSGKQDVIKLAEWIYDECGDLYLRRKRDRFFVNKKRGQAS